MTVYNLRHQEARAWLDTNCPPGMRQQVSGDEDICGGGRRFECQSESPRSWLKRMTDALDVALFMQRARVHDECFGNSGFHADRAAHLGGY